MVPWVDKRLADLPLDVARQVDAVSDTYEAALWKGERASIATYADRVPRQARQALLGELVRLELEYRRRRGAANAAEDLLADQATIRDELAPLAAEVDVLLREMGIAARRGLHVHCPHCQNPIELVPEAELASVDCPSCGSNFSLVTERHAMHDTSSISHIGHFELVKRIGVGAFGTVWKARDQTLDRTVAVKIPRAGQLAASEEEKFFAEARAAARLNHPYIVPVHEVGREGGILYIVSDYVHGVSLSEMLEDGPLPRREAVVLARRIAGALAHAHSQGIIHRDLKPQNVLVDEESLPHLTDFGLAKQISSEVTMTIDGVILGTPAYMSPEQARGEGSRANPAMDIYSLGALLFQLLTGELPFRGAPEMLLHKAIYEEPPGPRLLDASIPQDLETICLKCMEKQPRHRYGSVATVAKELQCWLDGKPIQARPVSKAARAWRWLRRNPAPACLILCGLILALGLVVSTVLITRQRNVAQQAARREAIAATESGRLSQLARRNAEQADRQRRRAEENLEESRDAVDRLLTRVAEDLASHPHMTEVRRELLEGALEFYQSFFKQNRDDPSIRHGTALAYLRVSEIQGLLGHQEQGIEPARRAIAFSERLVVMDPDNLDYQELLAESYSNLALRLFFSLQTEESVEAGSKALAIWNDLANRFPTTVKHRRRIAIELVDMGNRLQRIPGKLPDAETHFRQSLAMWRRFHEDFPELAVYGEQAHSHHWLANVLIKMQRYKEAETHLRLAVELLTQLLEQCPKGAKAQAMLSHAKTYLAKVLQCRGQAEEAQQLARSATEIMEPLVKNFPGIEDYKGILRGCYRQHSLALFSQNRLAEAEEGLRQVIEVCSTAPESKLSTLFHTAWALYKLGVLHYLEDRRPEAADCFRKSIDQFDQTLVESQQDSSFHQRSQRALAWILVVCPIANFHDHQRASGICQSLLRRDSLQAECWQSMGIAHYRGGHFDDAIHALKQSIARGYGGGSIDYYFLAMSHWQRQEKDVARQWYRRALENKENPDGPNNPNVLVTRREAERLLGVESPIDLLADSQADAVGEVHD